MVVVVAAAAALPEEEEERIAVAKSMALRRAKIMIARVAAATPKTTMKLKNVVAELKIGLGRSGKSGKSDEMQILHISFLHVISSLVSTEFSCFYPNTYVRQLHMGAEQGIYGCV